MRKVKLTSVAESEYADAVNYYLRKSDRAALNFDDDPTFAIEVIETDPDRSPRYSERDQFLNLRR